MDHEGNLIIAATGNQRIRVVAVSPGTFYGIAMTAGGIATVAGSGTVGYIGDSGPATSARLSSPIAVDVTLSGSLAFIDGDNFRVRTVSSG